MKKINKITLDLSDVSTPKKEMTEQERKEYCASISAVFPRIEKDIRKLMYEQLVETYTGADSWDKVLEGRGRLDGMAYLLEHWKSAHMENIAKPTSDIIDKSSPIPEI